jgi:hypothetical protein
MRPMSQQDHDDPRPLADDDSRLQTEDIANAHQRTDDEPTTDRSVADEYQTDEYKSDETKAAETPGDEAQTRLDDPPTEQLPIQEPVARTPAQTTDDELAELFPHQEAEQFRGEWQDIQARFVDDPRDAVQSADQLVAEVMRSLATTFTDHKHELEGQWQQGSDVETEDLRLALRRYRSFFNQLLNV